MASPAFEVLSDGGDAVAADAEIAYGGALRFPARPRPYIVANFVASIDGVASLGITDGTDSPTLSANSSADRYLMALLRANADAVIVGAGTLRSTPGHQWTPGALAGDAAALIDAYRFVRTGSAKPAPLVVVSTSGDLPAHAALDAPSTPVAVVTTSRGAPRVRTAHPLVSVIEAAADGDITGVQLADAVASAFGPGLFLCEGGPSLFGQLVADRCVHELFLTVSPRISGRENGQPRPGIVDGWAAAANDLRRATLELVRRSGDHLFLRYRLEP